MKVKDRIRWSLSKNKVEKLIVLLGFIGKPSTSQFKNAAMFSSSTSSPVSPARGAAACRIEDTLFGTCRPPPNDIHDPDRCRVPERNKHGNYRAYHHAYTQSVSSHHRHHGYHLRRPQQWDSAPVTDCMGLWCDRLLLGDDAQPKRSALLRPYAPLPLQPEAVVRAAQAHQYLTPEDVLMVDTTPALPVGVIRLWTLEQWKASQSEMWRGSHEHIRSALNKSVSWVAALEDATALLTPFSAPRASLEGVPTVLALGCGEEMSPEEFFNEAEEKVMQSLVVPLAAFTAALWTINPQIAEEYVRTQTPLPSSFTVASPVKPNHRLWKTMQNSMLSTRDTALLSAYFSNTRLDKRLCVMHQTYLAETLLQRLDEAEKNGTDYSFENE